MKYTTSTTFYDKEGNEIGYTQSTTDSGFPDPYVMIFFNDWFDWLCATRSAAAIKLLIALSYIQDLDNPVVYISPRDRENIVNRFKISYTMFSTAMNELEEAGLILRGKLVNKETGEVVHEFKNNTVMLNPSAIWRGSKAGRKQAQSLFSEYIIRLGGKI